MENFWTWCFKFLGVTELSEVHNSFIKSEKPKTFKKKFYSYYFICNIFLKQAVYNTIKVVWKKKLVKTKNVKNILN